MPIGDGGSGPALFLESSGYTNTWRSDCCLSWLVSAAPSAPSEEKKTDEPDGTEGKQEVTGAKKAEITVTINKTTEAAGAIVEMSVSAKAVKAKAQAKAKAEPIITHKIFYTGFEVNIKGKAYTYDAPVLRQLSQEEINKQMKSGSHDGSQKEMKPLREPMEWDSTQIASKKKVDLRKSATSRFILG